MTIVAISREMGSGGSEIGAPVPKVRSNLATEHKTERSNVEVTAQAGRVVLTGMVCSATALEAAADVAERVPAVTSVSCETVEIPRAYPGRIM